MPTPLSRWGNRSVSRELPKITEDFICSLRPHWRNARSENLECENLLKLQQTAKAGTTEDYIAWKLGTEKNWNSLTISERTCTRGVRVVEGFHGACVWWRASMACACGGGLPLRMRVVEGIHCFSHHGIPGAFVAGAFCAVSRPAGPEFPL